MLIHLIGRQTLTLAGGHTWNSVLHVAPDLEIAEHAFCLQYRQRPPNPPLPHDHVEFVEVPLFENVLQDPFHRLYE